MDSNMIYFKIKTKIKYRAYLPKKLFDKIILPTLITVNLYIKIRIFFLPYIKSVSHTHAFG